MLGYFDAYRQIVAPRNLECSAQIDGCDNYTIENQFIPIHIVAIHTVDFIYAELREYREPCPLTTAYVRHSLRCK
jgi:hypothetical protein